MVLVGKGGDWSGGEQMADGELVTTVTGPPTGAEGELTRESSVLRERLSLARAF